MGKCPKRRYDNTKLGKAVFLSTNERIRSFVPDTRKATKSTLASMLDQYGAVYVKPTIGTGGRGIFQVSSNRKAPTYQFQRGKTLYRFDSFEAMYAALKQRMGAKYHVVQRAIDLLEYERRPFDVRVMVQKAGGGRWQVTGIIGRVAHPDKVVTNYHNGGTPLPVDRLLAPHVPDASDRKAYVASMNRLGKRIAEHMQTGFGWVSSIGVDLAIDRKLKPWVLEVNTLPDMTIFRTLSDKSVFRRMVRLHGLHRRS